MSASVKLAELQKSAVLIRRAILAAGECRNSCILSTGVGLRVLARRGIAATPLTTDVVAVNDAWLEMSTDPAIHAAGGPTEADWLRTGAYSISVGGTEPGWAHHLVLVTSDNVLIDLSVDQYSRPEHRMLIDGPLVERVPAGFRKGQESQFRIGQAVIHYRPLPADRSYEQTHAWGQSQAMELVEAAKRRGNQ